MAEEKNVVILLRQPPHGTLYPVEGLRMTVAVSADFDPITLRLTTLFTPLQRMSTKQCTICT